MTHQILDEKNIILIIIIIFKQYGADGEKKTVHNIFLPPTIVSFDFLYCSSGDRVQGDLWRTEGRVQGDLYSRLDRKELVVKTSVKHTSGNEAIFHQR